MLGMELQRPSRLVVVCFRGLLRVAGRYVILADKAFVLFRSATAPRPIITRIDKRLWEFMVWAAVSR